VALPPKKPGAPRIGGVPGTVLPEFESGKERLANDQLNDAAGALEEELEEIKVKYEMYFIGAERMEPSRRRDDLKRNIARLKNAFTRNAGIRFRIQALHARYLSYERLWLRSAREKEQGTYRRDVLKARRKAVEAPKGKAVPPDATAAAAPDRAAAPSRDATAGTPPPLPAARSSPPAPASMTEPELRVLFDAYVAAKKSCNEDVSRLSYDALARTVNKQAPEIAAKFKAKRVEFKVSVRDGKAVLTAVPKI
jgi:hypothetical protein